MKPIFQSNSRTRRHRQAPAPETQAEQEPFFSAETKSPEQQAMPFFQAKATQGVKMGRPDDPFEREADTVADKVVNQKAGATTNAGQSITPVTGGSLQRIATPEEDKMPGTNDARMAQDKEIQEKPEPGSPILQKMDAPKEEEKPVQKMGDKEEEPVQKMDAPKEEEKPVQKMGDKEEEPMQAREEEEPVQAKVSSGTTAAQPNLGARLSQKKGSGKPLPKSVRTEMERGIGADFSGVRVHTDADAVDMNREVHAQAFTHGQDVYFNSGKYNPEQTEGKRLLAHELVHTVQQGGGTGFLAAPKMVNRWVNLGTWSWDEGNGRRIVNFRAGSISEWEQVLSNVDDANEYFEYLHPFLYSTLVENVLTTKQPPWGGGKNFKNELKRKPTETEILAMATALFNLKSKLDLPIGGLFEMSRSQGLYQFELYMSEFLRKYQSLVLVNQSAAGKAITRAQISNVAEQSGPRSRNAMIQNAGVTALKSIDLVKTIEGKKEGPSYKKGQLLTANEIVSNSARTIRFVLETHKSVSEDSGGLVENLFDVVWGLIPGGGTLSSLGKDILKKGMDKMIKASMENSEPEEQAEAILVQFVEHVNTLFKTTNEITEQNAIDLKQSFEAGMR